MTRPAEELKLARAAVAAWVLTAAGAFAGEPRFFEGSVVDQDANGVAESTIAGAGWVFLSSAERRAVAEFDASRLVGLQLNSARARGTIHANNYLNTGTRAFAIELYSANGTLEVDDFAGMAGTSIAVGSVSFDSPFPSLPFDFDAGAAVQSLLNAGASAIGIRVRSTTPGPANVVDLFELAVDLLPDGGGVDAGGVDAGGVDAGGVDAGGVDAGEVDAGVVDAGVLDAGGVDAGGVDAGVLDAGVDGGAVNGGSDAGSGAVVAVYSVGCGCSPADGAWGLMPFALLRRTRHRGAAQRSVQVAR